MIGTEKIEQSIKKYKSKAREYMKRPEKTDVLIKDASKKAEKEKKGLADIWENLQLLFQLVTAWRHGEYKKIPIGSILAILASIIYFVSPIDLIPDFLAGVGIVDDAAVIGFVLKQISSDLEKFRTWRDNNNPETNILEETTVE
ncbi:YkvA family protein [Bacillus sp. REN3]|uniref:YkvA family protein n=1 Tax=Bacillus sp. REN3 TaxID=2802440 RepID=UPI001AEE5CF8|nr:YkvA family protein [Bacillus sp. REN3]